MTHLDQAIDALQLKLDESEIKALEEPYEPHSVLGF
jgi:aryl-alcohol dehydrogenase (NADP+)